MDDGVYLESLCKQCGLCCHLKIGLLDGTFVIHPNIVCKYLSKDNLCEVYDKRAELIKLKICHTGEDLINQDYILVEGCPYTELRPGYRAVKVVSEDEFNSITLDEILKGNYNLMKVAEMLDDPNTHWKMINL
jgi:uncharacterized cysteine cluster protein YcgN (CxxCxxCC family)